MRKHLWFKVCCVMVCLMVGSLLIGRYPIALTELKSSVVQTLLYQIRLPRMLVVTLSGMGLALAGHSYQKVFHNPLVSPDILGATSGASLGACIGMVVLSGSPLEVVGSAFVGALAIVGITLALANRIKREILGFILSGMITSALASALVMLMKMMADPYKDLPSIEFWLMGSFSHTTWLDVGILFPLFLIGMVVLFTLCYQVDVLSLGEHQAKSLGMSVKGMMYAILIGATLLVASVVAVNGLISWVGLIAPHIGKRLCKGRRIGGRQTAVVVMFTGGSLLLVGDMVARTLLPVELPISILTSFFGAIVLGVMLVRRQNL